MTKSFSRWAKGVVLPERALCLAAREIEQGHFEADLGGGLCKKRIARPGAGKSGGTRTLVAKQHRLALFFLVGRSKSDPGTDFADDEIDVAKAVAAALGTATIDQIDTMASSGALKEICHDVHP